MYKKVDFWTQKSQQWPKLAKTSIFPKMVQKAHFWTLFSHKSREREFSQIWGLRRKLANHKTLHFRPFLAKTNNSIFPQKSQKLYFCPFCPFLEKLEFSRKIRLSLLIVYGSLPSCKISEKTNEPILRKVHYERTD